MKNFKQKIANIIKKIKYTPKEERVKFNVHSIIQGHHKVTYRNIPTIRCPFDYVMYQMILCETKPDLVIEIGTNFGGTTLYIANLMDIMGHGTIHSIDITKNAAESVKKHPRIKLFTDGWKKYDTELTKGFKKILIIEDASHMYEDSFGMLTKFSPLVSINSYYIVEDGIINTLHQEKGFHGGPLRAIREFLKVNSGFEVDRKYCDMFGKNATWNVNGYLKRVK